MIDMTPPIRPTQMISFPRSGHNLLTNILARYFSGDMAFNGGRDLVNRSTNELFQTGPSPRGEMRYCNYYAHCKSVPCPDGNVCKNHDGGLKLKVPEGYEAVFQYRHPVPAIISWYRLAIKNGWGNLNDSPQAWKRWLNSKIKFWKAMMKKWYRHESVSFSIDYSEFIASPFSTARSVLEVMVPGDIDDAILETAVSADPVRERSRMLDFRHLNRGDILAIERIAEIRRYGINTIVS